MNDELEQAFFILEHGSAEGLKEYLKAIKLIKKECKPVRHARWIPNDIDSDEIFTCSHCDGKISTSWDYDPDDAWSYCPYCGSRMDGDEDADTV